MTLLSVSLLVYCIDVLIWVVLNDLSKMIVYE